MSKSFGFLAYTMDKRSGNVGRRSQSRQSKESGGTSSPSVFFNAPAVHGEHPDLLQRQICWREETGHLFYRRIEVNFCCKIDNGLETVTTLIIISLMLSVTVCEPVSSMITPLIRFYIW